MRDVLHDLADRHDLTGYGWAADRIREAPEDTAPGRVLRYVLDRDAEWRDAARAEEDADLARHAARMTEDRAGAAAALERMTEAIAAAPLELVELGPEDAPLRRDAAAAEDVRALRIAAARASLTGTTTGPAADRALAILRELGVEP